MKPNYKTKMIDLSESEELIVNQMYKEMAKSITQVVDKYLKSPETPGENVILLLLAQAKLIDRMIAFNNHAQEEMDTIMKVLEKDK